MDATFGRRNAIQGRFLSRCFHLICLTSQVGILSTDGGDDMTRQSDDPGGCQPLESTLGVPGGAHRGLDTAFKLLAAFKGERQLVHLWETEAQSQLTSEKEDTTADSDKARIPDES